MDVLLISKTAKLLTNQTIKKLRWKSQLKSNFHQNAQTGSRDYSRMMKGMVREYIREFSKMVLAYSYNIKYTLII